MKIWRPGKTMSKSAKSKKAAIRYSLVIPIYNEEAVLPVLLVRIRALLDQLDGPAEAIFVDDGSRDTTWQKLGACCEQHACVRAIRSRRDHAASPSGRLCRVIARTIIRPRRWRIVMSAAPRARLAMYFGLCCLSLDVGTQDLRGGDRLGVC